MTNKIIGYKKYLAELTLDTQDDIIVGRVINTFDIISFHGTTVEEAKRAFHDVLDTYLDNCYKEGIEPARPYSGKFNLRIDPDLHKEACIQAARQGKSLNEFISNILNATLAQNENRL